MRDWIAEGRTPATASDPLPGTNEPWRRSKARGTVSGMGTTEHVVGQLLALAGLIGATIEYIEIVGRRSVLRRVEAERLEFEASGLRGMVRVLLADT